MTPVDLWKRYQQYLCTAPSLGLSLDISRMNFDEGFLDSLEPRLQSAYNEMQELERGAIANAEENRMVCHYWLPDPNIAPRPELQKEIRDSLSAIHAFVKRIHSEGR